MRIYRFAVQPAENGYFFLQCVSDQSLYTQAKSLEEALFMARDVVNAVYDYEKNSIQIELVLPPDVQTAFDRRFATKQNRKQERPSPPVKPRRHAVA